MIKQIYVFFIGILLATFVGVGVSTFYQGPKQPEYPIIHSTPEEKVALEQQVEFEKLNRQYWEENKLYSRNVSVITLIFSVVILVVSLTVLVKLPLISDGLLLGGLFTLIYSIFRGFESQDSKFRFLAVSVGLLVSLAVGYIKFIKNAKQ
jgi:uncharacterized membrane protein YkgB